MTIVFSGDTRKIKTADDLFENYLGHRQEGPDATKMGCEVERVYYQPDHPENLINTEQQASIIQKTEEYNSQNPAFPILISQEGSAQIIETRTDPYSLKDIGKLLENDRAVAKAITDMAADIGVKQCPFTNNPFLTHEACFANPASKPSTRIQSVIRALKEYFGHYGLSYNFSVAHTQMSIGYKDPDDLWNTVRRGYYLTPLMYLLGGNSSFVFEQQKRDYDYMAPISDALGIRGGIPDYFFQSESGEDIVRGHINHVLDTWMIMGWGEDGLECAQPADKKETPRDYIKRDGSIPQSLFDLSESLIWPDVKICNIRDSEGRPIGKRTEIRMWDTGPHQFQTLTLFCAALLVDKKAGAACDKILDHHGFGDRPADCKDLVQSGFQKALYHQGKYLDQPYGREGQSFLSLARDLYPVIEAFASRICPDQKKRLKPLKSIIESGWTDSRVVNHLFPEEEDLKAFMKDYPHDFYTTPHGTCFYQLWQDGVIG